MIQVRKAQERRHIDFGWLNTYHTFSFGDYFDPRHMGFRNLRVINEDWIREGQGFGTHPHRDMEILTYVLDGALAHKDSMGNGSVIVPGEVQRMSAGTGVTHSEFNHSNEEPAHLLQIWILPERKGITPGYEQKFFSDEEKKGGFRLVASPNGREGSVTIHQDSELYAANLGKGDKIQYSLRPQRYGWLQVARGAVSLNGQVLSQGDGAAISEERELKIVGNKDSEVLLFNLN